MRADCDVCMNYAYDEEYDCYECIISMDEDDYGALISQKRAVCPYFRRGDEYTIVRKQN